MGIWREVLVSVVETKVDIRYPQVSTSLSSDNKLAHLTVFCELQGLGSAGTITGSLTASFNGGVEIKQRISILAGQIQSIVFNYTKFAELNVTEPALWWPWELGPQTLHNLTLAFTSDASPTQPNVLTTRIGLRSITSAIDKNGYRLFTVNNRPYFLRGGGW